MKRNDTNHIHERGSYIKRALASGLLTITMITTLFPTEAFAAENGVSDTPFNRTAQETTIQDLDNAIDVLSDKKASESNKLIVISKDKPKSYYDATDVTVHDDTYLLSYTSSRVCSAAYKKFKDAGYTVDYNDEVNAPNTEVSENDSDEIKATPNEAKTINTDKALEEENAKVEATKADAQIVDDQVVVAVIDTGVDANNEIFKDRLVKYDEASKKFVAISDADKDDKNYKDKNSHGSLISEIITSETNSNVKIYPIAAFDKNGSSTVGAAYLAIEDAINKGVNVINLSVSGSGESKSLTKAIADAKNAGIPVVVAAGNNSQDVKYYMPGNIEDAITVSAVDKDEKLAAFSNTGSLVDYSAIGTIIKKPSENADNEDTVVKQGTSISAAYVSSYVANILTINKKLDVEKVLTNSAKDLGNPGKDDLYGNGYLTKDAVIETAKHEAEELKKNNENTNGNIENTNKDNKVDNSAEDGKTEDEDKSLQIASETEENCARSIIVYLNNGTSNNICYRTFVDRDKPGAYSANQELNNFGIGCTVWDKKQQDHTVKQTGNTDSPRFNSPFGIHLDTVGVTPYLCINTPTRSGYKFTGWTINGANIENGYALKNGISQYFFNIGVWDAYGNVNMSNITISANWESTVSPDNFVQYIGNGGQSNDNESVKFYSYNVSANNYYPNSMFLKSGYLFGNWNTQSNGQGKAYNVGDKIDTPNSSTRIYPYSSNGLAIDLAGNRSENGTNIQVYVPNYGDVQSEQAQNWIFSWVCTENGINYWRIFNAYNGKVLDIDGGIAASGRNVQLWDQNDGQGQLWTLQPTGDGYYYIKSKLGNLYLDLENNNTVAGNNVRIYEGNESDAQKWSLPSINTNVYAQWLHPDNFVQYIGNGKDNSGNLVSIDNKGAVTTYGKSTYLSYDVNASNGFAGNDFGGGKHFINEGFTFANKWNSSADGKGTDYVPITGEVPKMSVKSRIQPFNDRTFALDLKDNKSENGTNIQLWTSNSQDATNNAAQEYSLCWAKTDNGVNYWYIVNTSNGKVLDVNGNVAQNGQNVQLYSKNGSNGQLWTLETADEPGIYYIKSKLGNYYLDFDGQPNNGPGNGHNVYIWTGNKSDNQKWHLPDISMNAYAQWTENDSTLQLSPKIYNAYKNLWITNEGNNFTTSYKADNYNNIIGNNINYAADMGSVKIEVKGLNDKDYHELTLDKDTSKNKKLNLKYWDEVKVTITTKPGYVNEWAGGGSTKTDYDNIIQCPNTWTKKVDNKTDKDGNVYEIVTFSGHVKKDPVLYPTLSPKRLTATYVGNLGDEFTIRPSWNETEDFLYGIQHTFSTDQTVDVVKGSTVLSSTTPSASDPLVLKGWALTANETDTKKIFSTSEAFTKYAGFNLYARYKYRVKYNANYPTRKDAKGNTVAGDKNLLTGASDTSGTMNNSELWANVDDTISKNTFKKTGYTFQGWTVSNSSKADDNANPIRTLANTSKARAMRTIPMSSVAQNDVKYNDGASNVDEFPNSKEFVTLNAQWKPNSYTVKFNANGASGNTASINTCFDKITFANKNSFTKTGYKFVSWNTKADGSGKAYGNTSDITNISQTVGVADQNNATVNLYAQWEPIKYTVRFDSNLGDLKINKSDIINLPNKDLTVKYYETFQAPTLKEKHNYITFKNWNTKPDGSGKVINSEEEISKLTTVDGETITLYAQWTVNEGTVTVKSNYKNCDIQASDFVYSNKFRFDSYFNYMNCNDYKFGTLADTDKIFGNSMNYIKVPKDSSYYKDDNGKYHKFVGYSVDPDAVLSKNEGKIIHKPGETVSYVDLIYEYQAYNKVKNTSDTNQRSKQIRDTRNSMKENEPLGNDWDVKIYAIWDEYPDLVVKPTSFLQSDVKNMNIDQLKEKLYDCINKDLTKDLEDGTLKDNKLKIDYPNIETERQAMLDLKNTGSVSVIYSVTDSVGNTTYKTVMFDIISNNPTKRIDPNNPNSYIDVDNNKVRVINEKYYNAKSRVEAQGKKYDEAAAKSEGGLSPDSVWYSKDDYKNELQKCFKVLKDDSGYEEVWYFSHDDVLKVQDYINKNGLGNSEKSDALKLFDQQFKYCKKQ